jgi:hypothetical protein
MPGSVIGTSMNIGYPGSFSRNGDCIIVPRGVKSTDVVNIAFGDPVVLNTDNTYSKFVATGTAGTFAGVGIREVKQTADYYNPAGKYNPGDSADVIVRGAVCVVCNVGTPTAWGNVYVRTALNASVPAGVIGGFEAVADGTNTVLLTNAKFNTGNIDANKVVEIVITNRNA